jgi:diguanylate cyclase (GGDEF)-like protein
MLIRHICVTVSVTVAIIHNYDTVTSMPFRHPVSVEYKHMSIPSIAVQANPVIPTAEGLHTGWYQHLASGMRSIQARLAGFWPALGTLHLRMSLAIGLSFLVVLGCLCGYVGGIATQNAMTFQAERLKSDARMAAALLARNLEERETEIDLLRRSSTFVRGDLSGSDVLASLERLKSARKELAWVGIADQHGRVIAGTGGLLVGAEVSHRPWFVEGLRNVYSGDVHEAVLLAKRLPHRTPSGEPLRLVDFSAPILDDRHQLRGVLVAHAHWQWVTDVVASTMDGALAEKGTESFVIDRYGNILHPFEAAGTILLPKSMGPEEAGASIQWPDGAKYLTASTPVIAKTLQDLGWRIVIRQPEALALAPVTRLRDKFKLIGFLSTIAITLVAWHLSRRFSRPFEAVALATQTLKTGLDTPAYPRRPGCQELAQMIDAMKSISAMAQRDSLTGVFNRRSADQLMQLMFDRRTNLGTGYGVILIDADHFKKVNDQFGHQTGDAVLIDLCRITEGLLRGEDKLARIGGEEFLVLLPDVGDLSDVYAVAERIRVAIEQHHFAGAGRITASIGCAFASSQDRAAQGILERADQALYQAKAAGRNQVVEAWA